jgi:hypothetical protein
MVVSPRGNYDWCASGTVHRRLGRWTSPGPVGSPTGHKGFIVADIGSADNRLDVLVESGDR